MTHAEYIAFWGEKAVQRYAQEKILPSLAICQAILEQGWGEDELAKKANNFFSLNNYHDSVTKQYPSYYKSAPQEVNGTWVYSTEDFCLFTDADECLGCYYDWLNRPKDAYKALHNCTDAYECFRLIKESGFATDSKYTEKLTRIYNDNPSIKTYDERAINMQIYDNCRVLDSYHYIVTQDYNAHCANVKAGGYAQGIDLVPVYADGSYKQSYIISHSEGTVMYADMADGYGLAVWTNSGNFLCGYGHMSKIMCKVGQKVSKGTILGVIGSTGHSTGIHCHFEVRLLREGVAIKYDPMDLWGKDSFMSTDKFTWVDPTPYVNADLPIPQAEIYRVQTGAYTFKVFAKNMANKLAKDGYKSICKYYGNQYHIQVGAFSNKANANNLANELQNKGYKTIITTENGTDIAL